MQRLFLFLKGMCMGLADIVPGVSGGTMALILGIYTQFIDALKSLHLYWVGPLWRWVARGRKKEDWRAFVEEVGTMNLAFLVTLGVGIFTAIIIGSLVIPTLMEDYPVQMRAFFFGLIVASVWVPLKMISPGEGPGVAGVLLAWRDAAKSSAEARDYSPAASSSSMVPKRRFSSSGSSSGSWT
ncbi:MAG: DUF368 domain-containing protein [Persicimonas sp.]